jgi:hypothetical protein
VGRKSANNVGRERLQSELTSKELLCVWLSERTGTTIMIKHKARVKVRAKIKTKVMVKVTSNAWLRRRCGK